MAEDSGMDINEIRNQLKFKRTNGIGLEEEEGAIGGGQRGSGMGSGGMGRGGMGRGGLGIGGAGGGGLFALMEEENSADSAEATERKWKEQSMAAHK
jgi:hypothetical protein